MLRLNLFKKLFLSMLLVAVSVLMAMALYINWSFRSGFTDYINQSELERAGELATLVGEVYQQQGSWQFLQYKAGNWGRLLMEIGERPRQAERMQRRRMEMEIPPSGGGGQPRSISGLKPLADRIDVQDPDGHSLLPQRDLKQKDFNKRVAGMARSRIPVTADGAQVGWLVVYQADSIDSYLARRFLQQQLNNFSMIALFAAGVSLLLAWLLVRHFLRPVTALSQGTQALRREQYQHRIEQSTGDELGQLIQDFNALAATLEQQTQLRQQWITDISHELRTPLAVLRAGLEALIDGIRQPSAENLAGLQQSVAGLTALVDDLHQLSVSDAGMQETQLQPLELSGWLSGFASRMGTRLAEKQLSLQLQLPAAPLWALADTRLLQRLLVNLAENSFRYTDPGGQVVLSAAEEAGQAVITVEDSAPGVPDEALPRLFERLYRVDKSRSRAFGGSGLGLSICQSLVRAQGGSIRAAHSPLGGVQIAICLPLAAPAEVNREITEQRHD